MKKNPFLKIVGFTDLDINQNYFKIVLETVDKKIAIVTSKYLALL